MIKENFSLKAQAIFLFSGKVIAYSSQFILTIILVRILNKEEYGTYKQILLLVFFFLPIVQGGLIQSLYYFYPNAKNKIMQLIAQSYITLLILGSIFLILFLIFKLPVSEFFKGDISYLAIPAGVLIFFSNSAILLEHIFILEKKSKTLFFYIIAERIFYAIIILTSLIIQKSIVTLIWSLVCFEINKSIILFIYLQKKYKIFRGLQNIRRDYLISQYKYSLPLGLGRIVGDIGRKADQYILASILLPSEFAIYAVAKFQIPLIVMFYQSIGNVILPRISEYSSQDFSGKATDLWHKMIIKKTLITIPFVIFFLVMAEPIITTIYSNNYKESVPFFRIMILVLLIQMLSFGTIPRVYKETKFIFLSNLITMVVVIILSYILIKSFNLYGAAISSVIAYSINGGMQLYKSKKILGLKYFNFLPWREIFQILSVSLLAAFLLLFMLNFNFNKILLILMSSFVYFVILIIVFSELRLLNLKSFVIKLRSNIFK